LYKRPCIKLPYKTKKSSRKISEVFLIEMGKNIARGIDNYAIYIHKSHNSEIADKYYSGCILL